jgi:uracil-DNA glycosylase family 4
VIDPAEAIDALLAELHRQKAAGVRRVSVSEDSLKALKVMAGTAQAAPVAVGSAPAARPASAYASPAPAAAPTIVVKPASSVAAPVAPKITVNVAPAKPLPSPPVLTLPPGTPAERLAWVHARISECAVLREHLKAGEKPVIGHGSPKAKVLFVGEAPNMEEAEAGRVFVGDAGNLLRRILAAATLTDEDVYITSLMGWRPEPPTAHGKRPPNAAEVAFNLPYLRAQVEAIQPKVIVALGAQAFEAMTQSKSTIKQERGRWHEFAGCPLMPTFHPSYLLHNGSLATKRTVWEDFLQVLEKLGVEPTAKQRGYFVAPPAAPSGDDA